MAPPPQVVLVDIFFAPILREAENGPRPSAPPPRRGSSPEEAGGAAKSDIHQEVSR
jgi:hypothetical protein